MKRRVPPDLAVIERAALLELLAGENQCCVVSVGASRMSASPGSIPWMLEDGRRAGPSPAQRESLLVEQLYLDGEGAPCQFPIFSSGIVEMSPGSAASLKQPQFERSQRLELADRFW